MASRGGSLLEGNVERLLKLAGFEPQRNVKLHGYEIDVFVKYKTLSIIFECKQRDSGGLNLRNLIHEWRSKNEEIKASKVVLVITGIDVTHEANDLAKKYGIIIWSENKLNKLLDDVIEKKEEMKDEILLAVGLETSKEIQNKIQKFMEAGCRDENEAMQFMKDGIKLKEVKNIIEESEKQQKWAAERYQDTAREEDKQEVSEKERKQNIYVIASIIFVFLIFLLFISNMQNYNDSIIEKTPSATYYDTNKNLEIGTNRTDEIKKTVEEPRDFQEEIIEKTGEIKFSGKGEQRQSKTIMTNMSNNVSMGFDFSYNVSSGNNYHIIKIDDKYLEDITKEGYTGIGYWNQPMIIGDSLGLYHFSIWMLDDSINVNITRPDNMNWYRIIENIPGKHSISVASLSGHNGLYNVSFQNFKISTIS